MKKIIKHIAFLSLAITLVSCEEVVHIDLPTAPPRLVVEGNLDFTSATQNDTLVIKLSLTTDFYNPVTPKVNNALVWVEDGEGHRYAFKEQNNKGEYISTQFKKNLIKDDYKLHIEYNNDIYEATEKLVKTPRIEKVEQRREKFIGQDYYTIRIYYQDVVRKENELNYYFNNLLYKDDKPSLGVRSNENSKGQLIEDVSTDEDYEPGDKIQIDLHQISRNYHDYMNLVIGAINNGGGPFETPVSKIKGNVKNLTTPEKEALGYFRVTEKQTITHIIYEQPKP